MPCSVCNAPDGVQCNRINCPANGTYQPGGSFPGMGVLQFHNAPSRKVGAPSSKPKLPVFQPGSLPGTGVLTLSTTSTSGAPAKAVPAEKPRAQRCNHCRADLSLADKTKCLRCRAIVCGGCSGNLNRGCPRLKRQHEDLWIPDADRRGMDDVPWTPATCPSCLSVQWPRDLRPTHQGWGCPACLDEEDRAAWMLCEFRETTREQICGTWNMQKYGEDTNDEKTGLVLDGVIAMLRAETPDWILVQEVTSGSRFVDDLGKRLDQEELPYACSGHQLTLGRGSTKDHYILIYHVDKIAIIMGPLHVGANEGPEDKRQVRFWREKDEGVEGKVLPHRGSVVWLTCSLPYNGPYSLTWVMGVHTSPSGPTNKIPAQIHEIMTHAAKLRHLGVPVVLAGDWYMQKCAPDYSMKLDDAEWTLLATYYGTSLKHKNAEHRIQAADHLVVSDMCEVAWVRQFVPVSSPGQPLRLTHLNTSPCFDPDSFAMRRTPPQIWDCMKRWLDQGVDHTPVLARFTIRPVRARSTFVPGNLSSTIDDWQRSGLTSRPGVGDQGPRLTPRSYSRPHSGSERGNMRQLPVLPKDTPAHHRESQSPAFAFQPPSLSSSASASASASSTQTARDHVFLAPQPVKQPVFLPPPITTTSPSLTLGAGAWRESLRSIEHVELFGLHQSGSTVLICVRLPSLRQVGAADCGIHAAYNAHVMSALVRNDPTREFAGVLAQLNERPRYERCAQRWGELREQLARTQGLHLAVISEVVPSGTIVLPLLRTDDGVAVYEEQETSRVAHCVSVIGSLSRSPGACVFVAGRVQMGGTETHAMAGILRSYVGPQGFIAWEIIFADSAPTSLFDNDTLALFEAIVKWLDHPDLMLKRSANEQKH